MTQEVWALLIVQVCTTIVTVAGLYFKHIADVSEYRRTNQTVTRVQDTLENGIKTSLADTNAKVTAIGENAVVRDAADAAATQTAAAVAEAVSVAVMKGTPTHEPE